MTDFKINVIVDPSRAKPGLDVVDKGLDRIDGKATRLEQLLARTFAFVGAAAGIKQLSDLADSYTNIQNRLRTVTEGQDQLADVTQKLFLIANRTRNSFEGTAELYARVGVASKDLGIRQEQLLAFTESLNQAVSLSGAGAQEAHNGIIQLAQGMASGTLRGQDLRSVLEQIPVVADVIAKSLGVTRGQLRQMGEDGKITAGIVLKAFAEARAELNDRFAKSVPTIGQSFTVLQNNLLGFVGSVNQSVGVSAGLSKALLLIASNIDTVAIAVSALAIAMGVKLAAAAIPTLAFNIGKLTGVVLANPLFLATGGAAFAVGLLISKLGELDDQIRDVNLALKDVESGNLTPFGQTGDAIIRTKKQIQSLEDVLSKSPDNVGALDQLVKMREKLDALTGKSREYVSQAEKEKASREKLAPGFKQLLADMDQELEILQLGSREREVQNKLIAAEDKLRSSGVEVNDKQREEIKSRIESIQTLTAQNKILDEIKGPELDRQERLTNLKVLLDQAKISQEEFNKAVVTQSERPQGPESGVEAPVKAPEEFKDFKFLPDPHQFDVILAQVQREGDLLKLTNSEREIQNQLLAAEQQAKSAGQVLTEDELKQLEVQLRSNQELASQKQAEAALLQQLRGPQEQLNVAQDTANRLFQEGTITADEYRIALDKVAEASDRLSNTVSGGFSSGFREAYKQLSDVSSLAKNTVTDAFGNAEDAIANFAKTGKLDFSSFVDGIISDLAKLLARQALMSLLNIFAPGGGEIAGFIGPPARASGGPVQQDRPYLVGEHGPELFTPQSAGSVTPHDATQSMLAAGNQGGGTTVVTAPAPQVNVSVVNVTDPKEALSALDTPEGTQKVLNVINRNRTNVRRSIS